MKMTEKTIFRKNGQEVILYECYKLIDGKIKRFCIKETGQYFVNEKRAIRAANDLLLQKTLSKFRYAERKEQKRKQIGANKIIRIHKCHEDTVKYLKRWDGIIYLETKKRLCEELKEKLDYELKYYGFENAHAAIGFIERSKR